MSAANGFQPTILRANKQIHSEAKRVFYGENTWNVVVGYDFNYFRLDPGLDYLKQTPHLSCMRRFRLTFVLNVIIMENYPSFGLESYCDQIKLNATKVCRVLLEAPTLQLVEISWVDTIKDGSWDRKRRVLGPLSLLKDACICSIARVTGDSIRRQDFINYVEDLISTSNIRGKDLPFATPSVGNASAGGVVV